MIDFSVFFKSNEPHLLVLGKYSLELKLDEVQAPDGGTRLPIA